MKRMIEYIVSVKNDLSRDTQQFLTIVLNDFLMRPEVHNILIDINADLNLYKTVTAFNRARLAHAAFDYVRELEVKDVPASAK